MGEQYTRIKYRILRNMIVGADWSQLENRIIAILSGDPKLLEWYAADVDVHCETAKILFDLPDDLQDGYWKPGATCLACGHVDHRVFKDHVSHVCSSCGHVGAKIWIRGPQQRQIAKGARYAFHYGAAEETMLGQLQATWPDMGLRDVRRLRDKLTKIHATLARWQRSQQRTARLEGYVEAPLSGRRYQFYGVVDMAKLRNLPIQSTGADLANEAMLGIVDHLGIDTRLGVNPDTDDAVYAQLHDAIYLEGPNPFRLFDALQKHMAVDVKLNGNSLNFPIDVGIGWSWDVEKVKSREHLKAMLPAFMKEGEERGYVVKS